MKNKKDKSTANKEFKPVKMPKIDLFYVLREKERHEALLDRIHEQNWKKVRERERREQIKKALRNHKGKPA